MLALPGDRTTFQRYAQDTDAELRSAALEGLGRIREPEDIPALQTAFDEKGADAKVHLAAAFALVEEGKVDMAEFSPLQYLIETLDVRKNSNSAAAYLTELCRRPDVRKAVFPAVKDCTKDQKLALCGVFGSVGGEDVVPVLSTLSKDIDPDVSLAAVRGLRIAQARRT
jgi:HEAT repeat protein